MASRAFSSESTALQDVIERVVSSACFCFPGIVDEFIPGPPPISKVVPAIMRKVWQEDGSVKYEKMPLIINVPVVVPFSQSSGLIITLPIKKGDEGLIVFSDRMIDNFVENGGFQPPEACGADNLTTEPRAHSLTDAIFIPGIVSKPWGRKIENWNLEAVELRNLDRTAFISLGTDKNITIQTAAGVTVTTDGDTTVNASGAVNVNGAGGVYLNGG